MAERKTSHHLVMTERSILFSKDVTDHIRSQEWIDGKDSEEGWYNSYYDNHGEAVEGFQHEQVRMMLTGQVFSIMGNVATDAQIRKIVLYIAENFGNKVALEKLEELEQNILDLAVHPLKGGETHYLVLKRQGYRVLILEKNLVFYKNFINFP